MSDPSKPKSEEFVAIIDQQEVTDEVRDIAVKYDPLNRSGHDGFHVTEDGELHIDDANVMAEHRLIEKKIPNDAIRIVPLPSETGQLVHQYGTNDFRLYDLPIPEDGSVIGLLGSNGIGKSTALRILAGETVPNFGSSEEGGWERAVDSFRGTTLQTHLARLRDGELSTAYKRQRPGATFDSDATTVDQILTSRGGVSQRLIDDLDLQQLRDRSVADLSGGERQRVAIGATLATDADLYVFDEPSSFLDVGQRVSAARVIRDHVHDSDAAALVVEHDLTALDLLSDGIHVLYGESSGFGVVSQRLSVRAGVNQFLEGYLAEENVQIRRKAIEFPTAAGRAPRDATPRLDYPALEKSFAEFAVSIESGQIHEGEAVGILGENALGKTTFVKLLAGDIDADAGTVPVDVTVSYKPQHVSPDGNGTVRQRFDSVTDVYSREFQTRIRDPFELESLYDRQLDSLSGGELQRVGVALCLARDADFYLLDEPSAFLDVERRVTLADRIRKFTDRTDDPVLVVDHDLFVVDRISDRVVVFEGESGERGRATEPTSKRDAMNAFLSSVGVTFRRDERTGRPRVNKSGSQLDRQQKASCEYYYTE